MAKFGTCGVDIAFRRYAWLDGGDADLNTSQLTSTVSRVSSCESVRRVEKTQPVVSFSDTVSPKSVLDPPTQPPIFANPFNDGDMTPRRMSNASEDCDLPQLSAFASHRDTLARLHESEKCDGSDDDDDAYTPTQIGFSLFRSPCHHSRKDTLVRLHSSQNSSIALPDHIFDMILSYVDPQDYKNMRLTCQNWAYHLSQPKRSAAQRLPHEVLAQIFHHLRPTDFDAARHTCRAWLLGGLDHRISIPMLRLAGCHATFLQDIEQARHKLVHDTAMRFENEDSEQPRIDQIDQEWLISKRLATESRLSANWSGPCFHPKTGHSLGSFSVVESVDFHQLLNQQNEHQPLMKVQSHFTVSACSRYLLIVVEKEIFVYSLVEPRASLTPITRLVAGRKVIAASMDTTSGRQSVAALLEGRIGISWDLDQQTSAGIARGEPLDLGMKTDVHGLTTFGAGRPIPMQDLSRMTPALQQSQHILTRMTSAPDPLPFSLYGPDETVESLHGVVPYHTESPESIPPWFEDELDRARDLQAEIDGLCAIPGPIDIITRATNIYTNLGTSGDIPRSVAICPQRKCVAYGCRSGIELHWADAVTGTNLNRWFPLAAPSDHLYFLPQKSDVDSNKKLRLISSAEAPSRTRTGRHDSAPTRWKLVSTSHRHGRMQSMTRLFFGNLPFPDALNGSPSDLVSDRSERQGVIRTVDCDHYRAIPISDGSHVLFTDPATGLLCLGSDAPLGGPTKLMRKVCMVPPLDCQQERTSRLTCYRAGHDLRWGVRVVAVYDDGRVVLYNVPADCFERIRYIRSTPDVWDELTGVLGQSDLLMDVFMSDSNNSSDEVEVLIEGARRSSHSSTSLRSFRSLQVDGLEIRRVDLEVEDVQVECGGGGVKIWLFMHDGRAERLSIYTPRHFTSVKRHVRADGLIRDGLRKHRDKSFGVFGNGKYRESNSNDEDLCYGPKTVNFKVEDLC